MASYCNIGEKVTVTMGPDGSGQLVVYVDNRGPLDVEVVPLTQGGQGVNVPYRMLFDLTYTEYERIVPHIANPGTEAEYVIDYFGTYWAVKNTYTDSLSVDGYGPIGGLAFRANPDNTGDSTLYLSYISSRRDEVYNPVTGEVDVTYTPGVINYSSIASYIQPAIVVEPDGSNFYLDYDNGTVIMPSISGISIVRQDGQPDSSGGGSGGGERVIISKGGNQVFTRDFDGQANVSVTCGDDCRSDEIKVWINRSDNRFMCCKCHC